MGGNGFQEKLSKVIGKPV